VSGSRFRTTKRVCPGSLKKKTTMCEPVASGFASGSLPTP
jgi:hypothetical protein